MVLWWRGLNGGHCCWTHGKEKSLESIIIKKKLKHTLLNSSLSPPPPLTTLPHPPLLFPLYFPPPPFWTLPFFLPSFLSLSSLISPSLSYSCPFYNQVVVVQSFLMYKSKKIEKERERELYIVLKKTIFRSEAISTYFKWPPPSVRSFDNLFTLYIAKYLLMARWFNIDPYNI